MSKATKHPLALPINVEVLPRRRRSLRWTPLAVALAALGTLGGAGSASAEPTLERRWGTYFGGESEQLTHDAALDGAGNIYVLGNSSSEAGITTPGAHKETSNLFGDAFLAKFDSEGTLVWGTYFGGDDSEYASAIAIHGDSVVIVGRTDSPTGIATPGSFQEVFSGDHAGFAASFTTDGALQWGTYIGTSTTASGAAVDDQGFVYVVGSTSATVTGLGTPGTHQPAFVASDMDGYLVKFTPQGEVVWGTYYGGDALEYLTSVSVNALGEIYAAGETSASSAVPSAGAHQTVFGGYRDGYLVRFNPDGTRAWGTYYGGTNTERQSFVQALPQGGVLFAGGTQSENGIATPGSHQPEFAGISDGFLTRFDAAGTLLWGTYYGGKGEDYIEALAIDPSGDGYICGSSKSPGEVIATPNGYQPTFQGERDAYMAKLTGDGIRQWGTFYGGAASDGCTGLAVDEIHRVHMIGGTTSSSGIATPGAHDETVGAAGFNTFVAQFTLPTGDACTDARDCGGGPCVDGVCCDSACGDGADDCQTCSVLEGAIADGVCTPFAAAVVCRPSAGSCDAVEHCPGDAGTCPADAPAADGEPCDEGVCSAGACGPVGDTTGDTTGEPGAPSSSGDLPTTAPTSDASDASDATGEPETDAGGPQQDDESGCGCRSDGGGGALLGCPLLLLLAHRRRR